MKLVISKNKNGNGYYSKIQNNFNGIHTEKYLSLQLPKDIELKYGLYDVDGFLSTYKKKDETIEFKFVINSIELIKAYESEQQEQSSEEPKNSLNDDVFKDFGESIEIDDDSLPF